MRFGDSGERRLENVGFLDIIFISLSPLSLNDGSSSTLLDALLFA